MHHRKETQHGTSKMSQAIKAKDVPKISQTTKAKDVSKTPQVSKLKEVPKPQTARGKQNVKVKPSTKGPGQFHQLLPSLFFLLLFYCYCE